MPTASGHTTAIRATKVIGTDVQNMNGETIGRVEDIVLDKLDNKIMFAVVGFGGFLGIGEKYHALPWSTMNFNEDRQAYVVPYTKAELEAAPADTIAELTRDDGYVARNQAYDYYRVPPYWN